MTNSKIKALQAYYKQGGIYEVLRRLSSYGYLPKPVLFLSSKHVLALRGGRVFPLKDRITNYQFEQADKTVIDSLVACQGKRILTPREVFETFFDDDQTCYVVRHQGKTIAYFWAFRRHYLLSFDEREDQSVTLTLDDDEVFFGNGFIAEEYRLKGIFPTVLNFIAAQFPKGTRLFSSVDPINSGSLRAHISYGFTSMVDVVCLGIAGCRLFYIRDEQSGRQRFLGLNAVSIPLATLYNAEFFPAPVKNVLNKFNHTPSN